MQGAAVNRSQRVTIHGLVRPPHLDGSAARGRVLDRKIQALFSGHCRCSSNASAITEVGWLTRTAASTRRLHDSDGA
jgi:hypothetical protein